MLLRTLPLVLDGRPVGSAVLIRDVTEVKRRDRALLSKDATIREIHQLGEEQPADGGGTAAVAGLSHRTIRRPATRC